MWVFRFDKKRKLFWLDDLFSVEQRRLYCLISYTAKYAIYVQLEHDPPLVRPTYFCGYWAYTRRGQSFTWSIVDLNDLGLISDPPTRNASWSVLLLQKPCIKIIWILNYRALLSVFAWLFHGVASVYEVIWCEMWCRWGLYISHCPVFTVGSLCCTVSW